METCENKILYDERDTLGRDWLKQYRDQLNIVFHVDILLTLCFVCKENMYVVYSGLNMTAASGGRVICRDCG